MKFQKAFSLLELIFVMLIIALLASIALPYFSNSKSEAMLFRLKADLASIQSALAYAQNERILKNIQQNPAGLDEALINAEKQSLFYCSNDEIKACTGTSCCSFSLLTSPIYSNKKGWMKIAHNKYRFFLSPKRYLDFEYDPKEYSFKCTSSLCKDLL